MQWVCLVSGLTAFTRARNPERLPSMAVAPSVVHALTLFHESPLLSKYSETSVKTSSPLCSGFQTMTKQEFFLKVSIINYCTVRKQEAERN